MNNFADIFSYLRGSDLSAEEQANIYCRYKKALAEPIQVLLTGATGVGKSSVINALLGRNVAAVGVGPEPETFSITPHEMTGFVFWDTPGLGDTIEKDALYEKKISEKLNEKTAAGELCIDFVLVLVDGGSRDLGTTSNLVRQTLEENFGSLSEQLEQFNTIKSQIDVQKQKLDSFKDELEQKKQNAEKYLKEAAESAVKNAAESAVDSAKDALKGIFGF